jgi:DNA excision repair protein ERCC-2
VEVELILKDIEKEILGLGKKLGIDRQEARLGGTDLNFLRKISVQSMLAMEEAAEKFMVKFKTENSFLLGLTEFLGELIREKEHTLYLIERKNSLNITAIPLEVDEIAGEVLHKVHAGVIMSGTLLPLEMYADVLGVNNGKEKVKEIKEGTVGMEEQTEDAKTLLQHNKEKENFLKENNFDPKRNLPNSFSRVLMKEYKSHFPKNNRLNLFVDKTTTKYTSRSQEQYAEIAGVVDKVVSQVPGNTIVFFPSFELMENISTLLRTSRQKLKQEREMNQQAKTKLVNDFKLLGSRFGGVLLAVSGGSIAEGLDFPGEHLSCAIIAGIPYAKMNLYSNALIEYNEKKFRRGWDYGYNAPAINKALQAAGRVIRTETDTGVCVFLDQRFSEEKYRKFFPKDFEAKKTIEPEKEIEKFFS